jgi:hypothetical protein
MIDYERNITDSGITIYSEEAVYNPFLFIPIDILQSLLNDGLINMDLSNLPLRTRSKLVKSTICKILGFPQPKTFQKTKPTFPAQNMDVYIQKSMNLQIWNEEIEPTRRYVIIQVDNFNKIKKVKVITGEQLALYDKTGTLTTKYQAMMPDLQISQLFSKNDTLAAQEWYTHKSINLLNKQPTSPPIIGELLPISKIYQKLKKLEGIIIQHLDALQERNRGAYLHKCICEKLGFSSYADKGTFPDIPNQLIEVKLQTSPTIDLGLHRPNSNEIIFSYSGKTLSIKDIRYVIMRGIKNDENIIIKNLFISTGDDFFKYFNMFGGNIKNAKLQIPLPQDFFD